MSRVPEQMGIGFQLGTGNNCRGVLFPVKQSVGASVPVSAQFQMMDMPWERTVIGNTEKRAALTLVDLSSTVSAGTKVYIPIECRLSRGVNDDDDDNDEDEYDPNEFERMEVVTASCSKDRGPRRMKAWRWSNPSSVRGVSMRRGAIRAV